MFLENTLNFDKQTGWIEVVCGSMFSGKTEELIRRIKRAQFAGLKPVIFKPKVDTRDGKNKVVSHDNSIIPCEMVSKAIEIYKMAENCKVVGIDEAQFFERFYDKTLPKSMDKIAKKYGGKFERGKLDAVDTYDVFYHNTMDKIERGIPLSGTGVKIRDGIKKGYLNTNILRITPEMKAKIKKEGLPLFNMGGKVTKRKFMDKPIEGNRREM